MGITNSITNLSRKKHLLTEFGNSSYIKLKFDNLYSCIKNLGTIHNADTLNLSFIFLMSFIIGLVIYMMIIVCKNYLKLIKLSKEYKKDHNLLEDLLVENEKEKNLNENIKQNGFNL